MKKDLLKTICIALVALLCMGSLNAQNRTLDTNVPAQKNDVAQTFSAFKIVPPNTPAPKGMVNVTLEANNVWGDGTGYHLLLDETATQFGLTIPTEGPLTNTCNPPSTLYNVFSHKIPENAIPTCTGPAVITGSQTIQIPAGTYDWCIANPDPGWGQIWIAGGTGANSSRRSNYVFEDGKAYHILMHILGTGDACTITITDDGNFCPEVTNVNAVQFKGVKAKITWNAPSVTTGLTGYKIYNGATEIGAPAVGVTTFITGDLATGTHTFAVAAIYDDECLPKKVTKDLIIKSCGSAIEGVAVEYDANCMATVTWNAVGKGKSGLLFENGPYVTHPGLGSGGADVSALFANETSFGGNLNCVTSSFSVAEDFILDAPSTIEYIEFLVYQTGSPGQNITINHIRVEILDAAPNAGGQVVGGDWTTNRFAGGVFGGVYRTQAGAYTNTDRPLQRVKADMDNLTLPAGTYWIRVGMNGTIASGPWMPPCTTPTGVVAGNALQWTTNNMWEPWGTTDGAIHQAFPFFIYGEGGELPDPKYNVYMGNELVASGIETNTYTHNVAAPNAEDVEWCVTQVCLAGGESEAGCKTEKCGDCLAVTITVAGEDGNIRVSWTGQKTVNVYRNDVKIAPNHTGTSYLDENTVAGENCYEVEVICGTDVSPKSNRACEAGINNIVKLAFSIVPNPAKDNVKITAKSTFNKIEVVNFLGQTVISQSNDSNMVTLDVSNLTNGIYFVRIVSDNGTNVQKFVKQ